jgi:hypothetical protein
VSIGSCGSSCSSMQFFLLQIHSIWEMLKAVISVCTIP